MENWLKFLHQTQKDIVGFLCKWTTEEMQFSDLFGVFNKLVEIYYNRMHWILENTAILSSAGYMD